MAHLNFRKMNFITKNGLVQGVPLKKFGMDDKCLPCKMGKQYRKSHSSKQINSISSTFELLHMDLFGSVNVRSIGQKYYCLVITDDFSRFSWVFFLGSKDETVETLMDFFVQVENIYGKKIKRIRSDNGMEFKNQALDVFFLSEGIQHHFSASYEPQQNGVAEQKNRTLIEAERTMLEDLKLPVIF